MTTVRQKPEFFCEGSIFESPSIKELCNESEDGCIEVHYISDYPESNSSIICIGDYIHMLSEEDSDYGELLNTEDKKYSEHIILKHGDLCFRTCVNIICVGFDRDKCKYKYMYTKALSHSLPISIIIPPLLIKDKKYTYNFFVTVEREQ